MNKERLVYILELKNQVWQGNIQSSLQLNDKWFYHYKYVSMFGSIYLKELCWYLHIKLVDYFINISD